MPDDDPRVPDGADPNTAEQLRIARNDAKELRLDRDRYRRELDGMRGEYARFKESAEAATSEAKTAHDTALEKLRIDLTARATTAESTAAQATEAAKKRVMMADLRMAAREAGMHDLDGLKLLDLETATTDEDGSLTNADDLIGKMKEAKPYFFGRAAVPGTVSGNTGTLTPIPPRAAPTGFNARTASKEDYAAQKRVLTGRA